MREIAKRKGGKRETIAEDWRDMRVPRPTSWPEARGNQHNIARYNKYTGGTGCSLMRWGGAVGCNVHNSPTLPGVSRCQLANGLGDGTEAAGSMWASFLTSRQHTGSGASSFPQSRSHSPRHTETSMAEAQWKFGNAIAGTIKLMAQNKKAAVTRRITN